MSLPLIAIIDDDPDIVALIAELLADEGYATVTSQTAKGAAALIRTAMPRLVILDLRMEQADAGMVIIEALRADPATRAIPVILCSADIPFVRANAERLRAENCWVVNKPFDLTSLLATVTAAMPSCVQPLP